MRRLCALIALLLPALWGAQSAYASGVYLPPTSDPAWTPTAVSNGGQVILDWSTEAGLSADAEAGLYEMAAAVGTETSVSALAVGGILAGVPVAISGYADGILGWRQANPLGGFIYREITGESYTPTSSGTATLENMRYVATTGNSFGGHHPTGLAAATTSAPYWIPEPFNAAPTVNPTWADANFPTASFFGNVCQFGDTGCAAGYRRLISAVDVANAPMRFDLDSLGCAFTGPTNCGLYYRTDADFRSTLKVKAISSSDYSALSTADKQDVATSWPSQPGSLTSTQVQTAITEDNCSNPSSQTVQQTAACVAVGLGAGLLTFDLLKPEPNETYSDYVTRLQSAGYLGTATYITEPTDLPGYGPDAVTRVKYTASGTTHVLDPLSWPATNPSLASDIALTVRHNSSTATPAPTDGGTGSLWTPSTATPGDLNFTPLTSLSFGCKFPYGVFCYAATVNGWFDTSAIAPEFNFSIPKPHLPGSTASTLSYDVNMNSFDSYMSLIRDIESVVLWIGAVWMFCTRILGLQFGDPGEAIDEAMVI